MLAAWRRDLVVLIGQDRHVLVVGEDARMPAGELAGLTIGDITLGGLRCRRAG
jgi:hypothetical protein